MGTLRGSSPFFVPGPPAPANQPYGKILDFLATRVVGQILDIGGGLGAYSLALRDRGFNVTLAELDPECLASAKRSGLPVLDMRQTHMEDLKGKFDTIILVEVLEHVENPEKFLKDAAACARKKLLMTVPMVDDFLILFNSGLTYNHIAVEDHLHHFTRNDIESMLKGIGGRNTISTGDHLFPQLILSLLYKKMWSNWKGKIALSSVRFFEKRGWLPELFPTRIFAESLLEH